MWFPFVIFPYTYINPYLTSHIGVYVCVRIYMDYVYTCAFTHIFITTHVIILIRTSYMCHPRYTFKVGLNLRRYEVPTYTHFNSYNAPYRALPPDSISLLRLGSSTHGYHGCLLVPSSGESHFLPHKSPCADSTIAPTHHFTGCFHHPKKQQC